MAVLSNIVEILALRQLFTIQHKIQPRETDQDSILSTTIAYRMLIGTRY